LPVLPKEVNRRILRGFPRKVGRLERRGPTEGGKIPVPEKDNKNKSDKKNQPERVTKNNRKQDKKHKQEQKYW
jgi:hypothetical protein